MENNLKKLLLLTGLLISFGLFAKNEVTNSNTVTLTRNTIVPVRLTQNINGNLNNQGETIYFEVINNVKVKGKTVIPKGTFVKGKITSAESRKSLGKAGKLAIEARSLIAIDGQRVDFIREAMTSEGRKRTGATVAHVLVWGPVGLFAKGRAARIMLDSEYDLEVRSDVDIDATVTIEPIQKIDTDSLDLFFNKYKSKINFAKGKKGKDFYLNLSVPQSTKVSTHDISIININDNKLPKPIHPSEVNWNKKSNTYTARIPFIELVKYITPGSSNIVVQLKTDDDVLQGDASVITEWKMK